MDQYESELAKMARVKGCDGIICGHIHQAENRIIDGIEYMNSGDWVETMSALAEDHEGNWQLIYYNEIDFKSIQIEAQTSLSIIEEERPVIPLRKVSFESFKEDVNPPSYRL